MSSCARLRCLAGLAMLAGLCAQPAWAACAVSSDAGAEVRPLRMSSQADASLVISMSMAPKLLHLDYAAALRTRPACDLGAFRAAAGEYELYGDDAGGRSRVAIPQATGAPIALIVPVTDLLKAMAASKEGHAAPVDGYYLATVTPTEFTGWRLYIAMPDAAMLKRDMAQALAGELAPVFRNGPQNKTALFVPKG